MQVAHLEEFWPVGKGAKAARWGPGAKQLHQACATYCASTDHLPFYTQHPKHLVKGPIELDFGGRAIPLPSDETDTQNAGDMANKSPTGTNKKTVAPGSGASPGTTPPPRPATRSPLAAPTSGSSRGNCRLRVIRSVTTGRLQWQTGCATRLPRPSSSSTSC